MRKILFLCLAVCLLLSAAAVFAQEETLTITTFYPSPYGVYRQLRLNPTSDMTAADCDQNNEGSMYYDKPSKQVMVCKNTGGSDPYKWIPLGGGQPNCTIRTAIGGPPSYTSVVSCNSDEYMIAGGGRCETPGSDLCAGVSSGSLNMSCPYSNNSWMADCYDYDSHHEACSAAYIFCCKK